MPERIRVLLVDDHLTVAEALQALLSRQPDLEVVGMAANGRVAIRMASERGPNVILMDQNLPGESGAEIASRVRAANPGVAVVMLSAEMSQDELAAAVEAGAVGYVNKSRPVAEVVSAIRRAASGEILLSPDELAALMRRRRRMRDQRPPAPSGPQLTPRERDVLALMGQAADAERIATTLKISVNTTRGYIQDILEKLGAHSRLEAVVRATELGLLKS
jgi:DNA-binding NarL/FixJ family response regulator